MQKYFIHTIVLFLLFQVQFVYSSLELKESNQSKILGVFNSNEEYLKTFQLLIDSSKLDIDNYYAFAREVTLPSIKNFDHFLDVGPGSGQLTKLIGERFKKITLIDNRNEALINFNKQDFPSCNLLEKINQTIVDVNLNKDEFDLITLSHVLYYIPKNQWSDIIDKCFDALKKDGILVVTLNDEGEKQAFLKHFGGDAFEFRSFSEQYQKILDKKATVNLYVRPGGILTDKLENLVEVAGFYLMDAQRTASYQACKDYLLSRANAKTVTGEYQLTCNQLFLVIKKL